MTTKKQKQKQTEKYRYAIGFDVDSNNELYRLAKGIK